MSATRTGNKRLLRDLNQSIVFNMIVERGSISRTELAKQSGLPAATITRHLRNRAADAGRFYSVSTPPPGT